MYLDSRKVEKLFPWGTPQVNIQLKKNAADVRLHVVQRAQSNQFNWKSKQCKHGKVSL